MLVLLRLFVLVADRCAGLPRLTFLVVVLRVMQTQQVHAVVVAVGRAHCDMDVEFFRLFVVQEHALVHVEFDQQDRAVDLV